METMCCDSSEFWKVVLIELHRELIGVSYREHMGVSCMEALAHTHA